MSFYPDMVRTTNAVRAYHVLINEHGEMVVCKLGADGKPTGFAVTKTAAEMIDSLVTEMTPPGGLWASHVQPPGKHLCANAYGPTTWAELAGILALPEGKWKVWQREVATRFRYSRLRGEDRYIWYNRKLRRYVITPAAEALDAMHAPPPNPAPPDAGAPPGATIPPHTP